MKYFVTGGTGFIGSKVVRMLREAGHDVIALVRTPSKAQPLIDQGVQVAAGDITDKESMRAPMTGVDGVFHIAAWYEIGVRDASRMEQINIQGTRNVLELMRDLDVPKGVYTSTVGVFSNTHGRVVDESYRHTGRFLNHYERTKWQAHYEVAEPMIREGLPLVIVMPGLVYGPDDPSLAGQQIRQYLQGKLYFAPTGTSYCWGHVEDTARGHVLAMEQGRVGEAYILAGQAFTFIDALKLGEQLTGIPAPRIHPRPWMLNAMAGVMGVVERVVPVSGLYAAESLRTVAGVTYFGSHDKATHELGYTVRPLEDGLRETACYEMRRLGIAEKTAIC